MTTSADPFDELAALFLTEADPIAGEHGVDQVAPIDVLVVGHLPVRAGLWLVPYTDAVAKRDGATVLLRLDDDVPHVQLLRGDEAAMRRIEPGASLRDAVRALAPAARRWVVCPGRAGVAEQIVLASAERVTLLGGADEAARVAAYKQIKEVVRAAEQTRTDVPHISLAIVGCDEAAARRVFDGMNKTTSTFLGVQLTLSLTLPRMDAGVITGGYRQFPGEPSPSLPEVLDWIRADAPASVGPAAHAAPPQPKARHAPPSGETTDAPAPPFPAWETSPSVSGPWIGRRTVKLRPKAEVEVEPKQPCPAHEPHRDGRPVPLAANLPGLAPLPVRCPGHEQVELAVDQAGRLHLLGREDTLRQMQVVQRWAVEHRELISLACPDCALDPRRAPRLHLFTDRPQAVADLHGSPLRLHVLAPVRVGDEIGWYIAPLNEQPDGQ